MVRCHCRVVQIKSKSFQEIEIQYSLAAESTTVSTDDLPFRIIRSSGWLTLRDELTYTNDPHQYRMLVTAREPASAIESKVLVSWTLRVGMVYIAKARCSQTVYPHDRVYGDRLVFILPLPTMCCSQINDSSVMATSHSAVSYQETTAVSYPRQSNVELLCSPLKVAEKGFGCGLRLWFG